MWGGGAAAALESDGRREVHVAAVSLESVEVLGPIQWVTHETHVAAITLGRRYRGDHCDSIVGWLMLLDF